MERGKMEQNERDRLAEVSRLAKAADRDIPHLEELTRQAANFFRVPIVAITLVDQDRVWIKSHFGIDVTQVKREQSLCDLAIRENGLLIIPDTRKHPLASTRALVINPPGIRFYAAAPLRSRRGYNVGSLCIMDVHPRTLSEQDKLVLQIMAELASKELEAQTEPKTEKTPPGAASLDEIFEGGPVVVFKWRAAEGWPVEYVSGNVGQFGYAADDFLAGGLLYANIVHPEDLERVSREVVFHSGRGDTAFTQEYRLLRKNGQAVWVYDYTTVVRNTDGQITHYMGYVLDITARKEAESALSDSWAKYQAAVEGFDGFVYVCSPDYKIEYVNRRLLEQAGSHVIGRECYAAVFGRNSPCPCCATSAPGLTETLHWEGLSERDKHWYHLTVVPWRRADGSLARLVMAYDITARKENELATLRRDSILSSVAQVAEWLLRTPEWRHVIAQVLGSLGQAAEADRAFLVENQAQPDGRTAGTMCFEWTAPGIPPRIYAPLSHHMPYDEPGCRAWADSLKAGRTLEVFIRDVPDPLRAQLREHAIRSMVAIPVFVGQQWWGFLGFDFCNREKRCTPVELDALRTAAGLLGNVMMRHRFELALQKSDEQQRILLKAIPDLMFRLRSDGTFLDYKAERESDLAVSPERIIGNKIQDLLHAPIASLTLTNIRRALETRRTQIYEYDLNVHGTPRRYEARLVLSGADEVLAIVRDITERHLNQILLKTLWSAVEQTPDIAFITDAQARLVYVNKAFETATGYTAEEVLGQPVALLKSGQHDSEFYRRLWENLMSQRTVKVEFVNRRKDGTLYTQETTIIPVTAPDRRIVNFVAVARDVTERRKTEQAVRKLAAFPEANPNAVIELDRDGYPLYLNPAAREMVRLYGCSDVRDLLPQNHADIARQCLDAMREHRRVEKTLGTSTLSWSFFPIAETRTVHAYGTDITERLAMESQLRQLQKMEAVGRLAGGIAHDFNNILTAIMGYASILEGDPSLPDNARKEIREITTAAERAAHLTQQLLAFSRRQIMQRIPVHANTLIERLSSMLKRLIGENVTLQLSLGEQLPLVSADPNTLEQVITNMVINARDAMPNGGVVRIATYARMWTPEEARRHTEAKPGPTVCIEIADEGVGMTEEVKSHLFEPFFTTKEKGRGTGLGLATAYGIVRQHEGWIDVESQPDRGSVFRICIPVTEETPRESSPRSAPIRRRGTETVLLVEDEDRVRALAATVLSTAGYAVLACGSGAEALEIWQRHKSEIALLISDVVMPGGMSGPELAEKLFSEKAAIKVILISGYSRDASTIQLPAKCPHRFLAKPFSPADLTHAVAQTLESRTDNE